MDLVGTTKNVNISRELADYGVTIVRIVESHSYARNGNAHNPTPRYRWEVFIRGRRAGMTYKLSIAKEIASEFIKNPEW